MDFESYEQKFRHLAVDVGYSEQNIVKCLNYAKPLIDNNYPVIYNSSHLSSLVGYKRSYIKRAVIFTEYFYRNFSIRKKNGNLRNISEPLPSLKEIQSWILNNVLYNFKVSRFAKAYIPEKTLLDNLRYHKNQEIVMCLDIKDFFTSISKDNVFDIFRSFGYSSRVSNTLSSICCLNNSLPQGAPTSPQLSNIFMLDFDTIISAYCISKNIRYSRYADDLCFSGDFDTSSMIEVVSAELKKLDLILNEDKTRIMTQNMQQIVTGIVVNKKFQVPKKKRKQIRQALYYIEKFGLVDHLLKINCSKANYLRHMLGLVNYVLFINPKDEEATLQKQFLKDLINNKKPKPLYLNNSNSD